jgi:hypothetical protein
MMDFTGLTPSFFLQVFFIAGAVYGAVRLDLKYMHEKIADEKRLREVLAIDVYKEIHDVREGINSVALQVAVIEGERRKA